MHRNAALAKHSKEQAKEVPADDAANQQPCWAQDLMHPEPVFLYEHSTILDAINTFRKQREDNILVLRDCPLKDGLELVGRVSIKDICRLLFPYLMRKDTAVLSQITSSHIKQILIPRPQTVGPWSNIKQIISIMLRDQTQVVGVEKEGKWIGQIGCTGLLQLLSQITEQTAHSRHLLTRDAHVSAMVSEIAAGHILCLSPQDDIAKAICVLLSTTARQIPVLNKEAKLQCILSQNDIMNYIGDTLAPANITIFENKGLILDRTIGSLMCEEVTIIPWNTGIIETAAKMIQHDKLCMAVTDIQHKFHGIVSCSEILHWLCGHMPA